ncbi:hypothetical protein [Polaribacter sp.]|uniref:hypothetical protein n=1 Tax=Polaribacter sp. TaxID=1920175 RepID=UPI003F6BC7B2
MGLFETFTNSSDSIEKGKNYIDATYKYAKLKSFHLLSLSISTITKIFFIGVLFIISLLFMSIALAVVLGEYLQSLALGYLIVGGIFLIFGIVIYLLRKKIDRIIIKILAEKFSK